MDALIKLLFTQPWIRKSDFGDEGENTVDTAACPFITGNYVTILRLDVVLRWQNCHSFFPLVDKRHLISIRIDDFAAKTYTAANRKYSIDENVFLFYWNAHADADWTCERKYVALVTSYDVIVFLKIFVVWWRKWRYANNSCAIRIAHQRTFLSLFFSSHEQRVIGFAHRFFGSLCSPFSTFQPFLHPARSKSIRSIHEAMKYVFCF